jgi:hypothetical protein
MKMSDYYFATIKVNKFNGENVFQNETILMFIYQDQLDQYQKDGGVYTFFNQTTGKFWRLHLLDIRKVGDLTMEMIDELHRSVNHTDLHSSLIYEIEDRLGNIPSEYK